MNTERYYSGLGCRDKIRELLFLLRANAALRGANSFAQVFEDVDEYEELLNRYGHMTLQAARVFEVGFGRRPERLVTLTSQGVDASGADLCAPLLKMSPMQIVKTIRLNGIESATRSLGRYVLFDFARKRQFAQELSRRGHRLRIESHRFIAHDIATLELPKAQFDMIYSENVFEHIPEQTLQAVVPKLCKWLKPSGIALIRPDIFTGPWGGHLCESLHKARTSAGTIEPWEHLRKSRFKPSVYLNRLTRAQYRELFRRHFEVLEERVTDLEGCAHLLTPKIAHELLEYSTEELLSNRVLFVLRPKHAASRSA